MARPAPQPSTVGRSAPQPTSADIARALAEDEVELLFQPQVRMADGAIVGAEALARWRHPEHGPLGAEPLLAAATRAGKLAALSRDVHRKAIAAAAGWGGALAELRVAINVTSVDLAAPGFADGLLAMIAEAGLAPARVTVEVTETQLIETLEPAAALLARLRDAGLRTAIDDFGTGYSSLAYLKALPLDDLKLDGLLSRDIAGSARDQVVVRAVLEMARGLGLSVTAEGVESEDQRAALAEAGCALWQGFLCAPPLDEAALAERVAEQR